MVNSRLSLMKLVYNTIKFDAKMVISRAILLYIDIFGITFIENKNKLPIDLPITRLTVHTSEIENRKRNYNKASKAYTNKITNLQHHFHLRPHGTQNIESIYRQCQDNGNVDK